MKSRKLKLQNKKNQTKLKKSLKNKKKNKFKRRLKELKNLYNFKKLFLK